VRDPSEDERRVYYVGMTRAQETLCLLDRRDVRNPFAESLSGDFVFRRDCPPVSAVDAGILNRRYELIGMADVYLDMAGRRRPRTRFIVILPHCNLATRSSSNVSAKAFTWSMRPENESPSFRKGHTRNGRTALPAWTPYASLRSSPGKRLTVPTQTTRHSCGFRHGCSAG